MNEHNTLVRAFELARTGIYSGTTDIKRRLSAEGYEGVHEHLTGAAIKKQLISICSEARASRG